MPPLTAEELDRYLARIGTERPEHADVDALERLQLAHLSSVPFENLDIHRDVPIELDHDRILAKIVGARRGGYCYEANSLFCRLLTTLGFRVDVVSARVVRDGEVESQEFAHLALLVDLPGGRFLTDVAFGDAFETPLPLVDGFERVEWSKRVRLVRRGDRWAWQGDRGEGWQGGYTFSTEPRRFAEFAEMNLWQQTAPESVFRTQPMCTMLTGDGRTTIAGDRLIETGPAGRTETVLSEEELVALLRDRFGVVLA